MVTVARAQQKALGFATSLCALAVIARLTLTPLGHEPLPSGFHWCVFCGTYGVADFLLNIALFVPLGWGLRTAGIRRWPIYLFGLLLAVTIETLQNYVISGRESGLNDIIANPLGGILGVWLADSTRSIVWPDPTNSRRLALGVAGAWLAMSGLMPWLMRPSLPRTRYWEQVAHDLPKYGKYRGQILTATFNGQPFRDGRLSDSASASMRADVLRGGATVVVTTIPALSEGWNAEIVGVADQNFEHMFMVSCARSDLMFAVRTRLDDLRFHSPVHRLPGAITCDRPSDPDTIRIVATIDRVGLALSAEHAGHTISSRPSAGAWQGWRVLVSDLYGTSARYGPYLTAVWVILWMSPLGYWLARTSRWSFRLGVSAVTLVASLAIIPVSVGVQPASVPVWIAGLAGVTLGSLIAVGNRKVVWM